MSLLRRLSCLLIPGLMALAQPVAAQEAPTVIALKPYLGVLWSFEATTGSTPGTYLLDTAGGLTVITPQTATAAGCVPWGRITGFRMRGDRVDTERCDQVSFDVGGMTVASPSAGVWDLSVLLPKDAPPLAGSVALDAFAGHAVTLDLKHSQLIVETADSLATRTAKAIEVPVRFSRDAGGLALTPLVAVETAKGRVWMELDSGSVGAVVVNRAVASALGLDPQVKGLQTVEAVVAGGVALKGPAMVDDLILDGNIGTPILTQWVVTIDLAAGRLWIAPAE